MNEIKYTGARQRSFKVYALQESRVLNYNKVPVRNWYHFLLLIG